MLGRAGGFSRRPVFLAGAKPLDHKVRSVLVPRRAYASLLFGYEGARRDVSFLSDDRPYVRGSGREVPTRKGKQQELIMHRMMASLIALSVLAGTVTAAAAATKQDEDRGNFWQQQQDRLP
jgi:hypothetical protein